MAQAVKAKAERRRNAHFATIVAEVSSPSGMPTDLSCSKAQVFDAALGRALSPEDAIRAPRVGYYDFDVNALTQPPDTSRSVVDPRFAAALLCTMKGKGFTLVRSMPGYPPGIVDTGFPTLVTISPGALRGMTPELVDGVAAAD